MEHLPIELFIVIVTKLKLKDIYAYTRCCKLIRDRILQHKRQIVYDKILETYSYSRGYPYHSLPSLYFDPEFYLWIREQPNLKVSSEWLRLSHNTGNTPAMRAGLRLTESKVLVLGPSIIV